MVLRASGAMSSKRRNRRERGWTSRLARAAAGRQSPACELVSQREVALGLGSRIDRSWVECVLSSCAPFRKSYPPPSLSLSLSPPVTESFLPFHRASSRIHVEYKEKC